jgi:hypothetical protein
MGSQNERDILTYSAQSSEKPLGLSFVAGAMTQGEARDEQILLPSQG